ncbi:MAG: hypothetical protein ACI85O_003301, partial [Saprospiraceae bacterium]
LFEKQFGRNSLIISTLRNNRFVRKKMIVFKLSTTFWLF